MAATSGTLGIFNLHSVIAESLAPIVRDLQDIHMDLLGSPCELLRITRSISTDIYGQPDTSYSSSIIKNCVIQYPLSNIQLFDTVANQTTEVNSIDLMEILSIKIFVKHSGNGIYEILNIEPEDIIIHVLKGANGEKIPIRLKVNPRAMGSFLDIQLVSKYYEATLQRGVLKDDIELIISNYIASL